MIQPTPPTEIAQVSNRSATVNDLISTLRRLPLQQLDPVGCSQKRERGKERTRNVPLKYPLIAHHQEPADAFRFGRAYRSELLSPSLSSQEEGNRPWISTGAGVF